MPWKVPQRATLTALFVMASAMPLAAAPPAAEVEFFEAKIRPVLVSHCFECHTGKEPKGGLRLDSRQAWATGGDSGPAIVPGKPDDSPLIQAIRYDPTFLQMPPKRKLPEQVVKDFERWVEHGAVDPRTSSTPPPTKPDRFDLAKAREFWAYRLPVAAPLPPVRHANWPHGAVDRFVLARLEKAGLAPVADADRTTLVRRLYFDLVGLPPTPEQIREFVDDPSPSAYGALVDRLLASPQFGERWGRHWLDVVRFGESITLRGRIHPEAWRYRDYVIDSFNEDRPYDRFLLEQVAGDLLPSASIAERRRQRTAVAFLALGNTNLEEQDKQQLRMDVVDEQLDTIGKAFMAQTFGCARCHDHKFDPIPTRDYYAMAGILRSTHTLHHANVSKPIEVAIPLEPKEEAVYVKYQAKINELESQMAVARHTLKKAMAGDASEPAAVAEVLDPHDLPGTVVDDAQAKVVGKWSPSQVAKRYIGSGYMHDGKRDKGAKTLTFVPELPKADKYEVRLAYIPGKDRAPAVPVTIFSADGELTVQVDMRVPPTLDERFVSLGAFEFEANGQGFVIIATDGTEGYVTVDAVQFLPVESTKKLLDLAKDKLDKDASDELREAAKQLRTCEAELATIMKAAPERPKLLSVEEERQIENARVHVRGSVHNLGPEVSRGFLQVATYDRAGELPSEESGRREFGNWLSSPTNPLTARCMVNRVWHWLMGAGLVRTTDNFGVAGEPPSHPELLDYLAVQFVEQGWSVKRLVREIVTSHAYRLSSETSAKALAADPENRLHWRCDRRRLDAECIRDAMFVVSGQLDATIGGSLVPAGKASDYGLKVESNRRSVYLPVFRNSLPEIFEAFDFADPSVVTGARNVSTVAPQALFLMNHPAVIEQARAAARRLLKETTDESAAIDLAFERTLGRQPRAAERQATAAFLQSFKAETDDKQREAAWTQVFQGLFASIDFRYVD